MNQFHIFFVIIGVCAAVTATLYYGWAQSQKLDAAGMQKREQEPVFDDGYAPTIFMDSPV